MTLNWRVQRQDARSHLRVECLEDRTVPSTFTVNTTLDEFTAGDGKLSLREAITRANTTAGADTILVPAGLYKITIAGANEDDNTTGDFDIKDAVTFQGAGAGLAIVDAQRQDRIFDVIGFSASSIQVIFAGITIRNGDVDTDGGGIRVANADLVVRDSAVTGNRTDQFGGGISNASAPGTGSVKLVRNTVSRNVAADSGGGIFIDGAGSPLTVQGSTLRRNISGNNGGGIYTNTATLTGSTLSSNIAIAGVGGGMNAANMATLTNSTVSGNSATIGGGIVTGTATLTNSTVSSNSATIGGGIAAGVSATLTNSTVSGNSATTGFGGGIETTTAKLTRSTVSGNSAADRGGGIDATTATLTNSTVSGNSAGGSGGGGGIFATTATLTNSTVSGNSAGGSGGGIDATTATLLNCSVVENVAHTGGGVFHNPGGNFTLTNTIVALNLVDFAGTNPDVSGVFINSGHNLIGDGTGGTGLTNGDNGNIVGDNFNPIDPKLGPLANNGGPTKTHALLAGSKAIDQGDNSLLPPTDQRGAGFPRKKDGNGDGSATVDIGAFER